MVPGDLVEVTEQNTVYYDEWGNGWGFLNVGELFLVVGVESDYRGNYGCILIYQCITQRGLYHLRTRNNTRYTP